MEPIETLEAAVGRAVRFERERCGITLDQLATAVREHGVRWSTARVLELEKGRLRLTLPMMLALVKSLEMLTDRDYVLSDLLPDDRHLVRITDQWTTPRGLLREVLDGVPARLPILVFDADANDDAGRVLRQQSAVVDDLSATAGPLTATLAEERAARRLGVRPRQVAMWSYMLWGAHLDEEVTRRVGADASAQARGHVTRELVAEIAASVDWRGGPGSTGGQDG